jgi:exodeoxyribonuclease-3
MIDSMNILSLNIRHGGGSRVSAITHYLEECSADVIVLSEFRVNKHGSKIIEFLESQSFVCDHPSGLDDKQNTVLVASRSHKVLSLESLPNAWSIFGIEREGLKIFGVYFPLKNDKKSVFDWFNANASSFSRTVLIGDFNTGNNDRDLEGSSKFYCETDFSLLTQKHFFDAYRLNHPKGKDFSWYSSVGNGFRIDHVLISRDIDPDSVKVSYDHKTREEISDHSSLFVSLKVR